MPLTNYAEQNVVLNLFGAVTFTLPTNYYLALSSTTPTQAKGLTTPYWNFTEPTSTGGYARLAITNNTTNFGAIASEPTSGYTIQNNVSFAFTASAGAYSTGATPLTYGGIFDASSGGNLWGYGALSPSVTVNQAGVVVTFSIAQFIANLT